MQQQAIQNKRHTFTVPIYTSRSIDPYPIVHADSYQAARYYQLPYALGTQLKTSQQLLEHIVAVPMVKGGLQ